MWFSWLWKVAAFLVRFFFPCLGLVMHHGCCKRGLVVAAAPSRALPLMPTYGHCLPAVQRLCQNQARL